MNDMKDFVKLSKKIGFPRGQGTHDYTRPTKYGEPWAEMKWFKRGGHAGRKSIAKVTDKAIRLGFTRIQSGEQMIPDGSYVGYDDVYTKIYKNGSKVILKTASSYGVTNHENSFSIQLKGEFAAKTV